MEIRKATQEEKTDHWNGRRQRTTILGRTALENILRNPQTAPAYVYTGRKRTFHIIWLYSDILPCHTPLAQKDISKLKISPTLVSQLETILGTAFEEAVNFQRWEQAPPGMVIDGITSYLMEAGSIMGPRVSFPNVLNPLIEALNQNDQKMLAAIQSRLAGAFAHEMTHYNRDDGLAFGNNITIEVASNLVEFLCDPHNNILFNQSMEGSLDSLARFASSKGETPLVDSVYDSARYAGLLLLGKTLCRLSQEFKELYDKEPELHFGALRKIHEYLTSGVLRFVQEKFLPAVIATSGENLVLSAEAESSLLRTIHKGSEALSAPAEEEPIVSFFRGLPKASL